jgi:competence CoiA-like predicted nuclease
MVKQRKEGNMYSLVVYHDNNINLNSCCGGGCYAMQGLLYCPFCGKRIVVKNGEKGMTKNEF